MTRLSAHFNISLNPNPKPLPLHLSHLSMIVILFVGLTVSLAPTLSIAYGTNEGSYQHGFWKGSLTGPQFGKDANWNPYSESDNNICALGGSYMLEYPKEVYGIVIPAVTNTTACQIGFFSGWKNWCSNHAVDCVQNITRGDFPPIILQLHEQYLRGYNAANGSGNSMCPIGNNAAFCQGWDENNGDYGESDCGDAYVNYTGPFSNGLIGCPLDTLKASQMAALPMLVGNWDFVNETNRPGISGTMKFGANGDVNMTVPSKTAFGDYRLETSWGYIGHNILTQCMPSGGCENSTLTTITPNHIEFTDNHGDRIHLMRGDMALKTNSSQLALTPYQSGYQRGAKDAKTIYGLGNFMPKEGFGNHTKKFNKGYIDGWCANSAPGLGSDADQGTFECDTDTTAAKNSSVDSRTIPALKTNSSQLEHQAHTAYDAGNYTGALLYGKQALQLDSNFNACRSRNNQACPDISPYHKLLSPFIDKGCGRNPARRVGMTLFVLF